MSQAIVPQADLAALRREELALLEQEERLREGLPFLYGWPWYKWAHEFFESTNRMNFLCAANQISKSSTQIRKCIDWATNTKKWPSLWRHKPMQFWYLYPTKDVAKIEFETKWKQFLPKGEFKNHPVYGWKEEWQNKALFAIHFNSGVHVYFKTYAMDESHLQSGSCDAIFCDEELPTHHLDELLMRMSATDGYFHMVFTATLGQDYWRRTIEPKNKEEELYADAFKLQISLYNCLNYMDGSPSPWTHERILRQTKLCSTKAQVQRRIFGKFAVDKGLKYESFDRERNMKPRRPGQKLPPTWHVYEGVDIGSGGKDGHPSAICFVAVDPTFRTGRVFLGWRGDEIATTAGDVVLKHIEMKKGLLPNGQYYDHANADFFSIATSMGESFQKAEKAHDKGEEIINVLFKNQMLYIYEGDPELEKLAGELVTLRSDTPKNKAKDDFCDALRYACSQIPWDFSVVTGAPLDETGKVLPPVLTEEQQRRLGTEADREDAAEYARVEDEMEEWNDLYE